MNYKIKKQIAFAVIALVSCAFVSAQQPVELQVYGGGGLSQLQYSLKGGKVSLGFGGHAGLGATFFFNKYLGLHTGAEVGWYNARVKADGLQAYMPNWYDDYQDDDEDKKMRNSHYNLTSGLTKYTEKQKLMMVNVPVALQFQTVGRFKYYFLAGVKIGIPIKPTYSVDGAVMDNIPYYPDADNSLDYSGMNEHFSGFGHYENRKSNNDFDMKISFMATFETGIKFSLAEKVFLYWGLYCDYGFNDVREKKGQDFIQHVDGALIGKNFVTNSLLASNIEPDKAFTNKVVPLSAGLKLRLSFGVGKTKSAVVGEPVDPSSGLTAAQKAELEKQRQLDAAEKRRLRGEIEDLQQRLADVEQAKDEAEFTAQQLANELLALKPTDVSEEEFQRDIETIEQSISDVNESDSTSTINYFTARTEITENQRIKLDAKIVILKKYPNLQINIIGHTDDIGSEESNMVLGMRRAQGVKDYLVAGGINTNRINVQSRGESEPLVPNTSDFNRIRNRRVEINVVR